MKTPTETMRDRAIRYLNTWGVGITASLLGAHSGETPQKAAALLKQLEKEGIAKGIGGGAGGSCRAGAQGAKKAKQYFLTSKLEG